MCVSNDRRGDKEAKKMIFFPTFICWCYFYNIKNSVNNADDNDNDGNNDNNDVGK